MLKLTPENYYTQEANNAYWSASFVKEMLSCPARAIAELNGEWTRPSSSALAIGSYVDEALTGDIVQYRSAHPELFKRDGTLKADFELAEKMITRAETDRVFMEYLTGEYQHIVTGDIDGIPFKGKLDVYVPGERIVDLKTVRDMKSVYKPGIGRVNFAEAWNWPLQLAIYQHLEGHRLPCYLAVVTKEDPSDLALIEVEQYRLDAEMEYLREILPKLDAMRNGIIEPERCDDCAYCRFTRKITEPVGLDLFDGGDQE